MRIANSSASWSKNTSMSHGGRRNTPRGNPQPPAAGGHVHCGLGARNRLADERPQTPKPSALRDHVGGSDRQWHDDRGNRQQARPVVWQCAAARMYRGRASMPRFTPISQTQNASSIGPRSNGSSESQLALAADLARSSSARCAAADSAAAAGRRAADRGGGTVRNGQSGRSAPLRRAARGAAPRRRGSCSRRAPPCRRHGSCSHGAQPCGPPLRASHKGPIAPPMAKHAAFSANGGLGAVPKAKRASSG